MNAEVRFTPEDVERIRLEAGRRVNVAEFLEIPLRSELYMVPGVSNPVSLRRVVRLERVFVRQEQEEREAPWWYLGSWPVAPCRH